MDNLPVEISSDILSRLPVDTLLECKRVCKTWRNLILHDKTNFVAMHLLRHNHNHHDNNNGIGIGRSEASLGLIFSMKSVKSTCHPLYYGEFDENNITDHNEQCLQNTLKPINHPLIRTNQKYNVKLLIGSCNGLICLAEPRKQADPIHICNPITRECLNLQGFNKNNEYDDVTSIHSGFGYSPRTNEYKVVRILYRNYSNRGNIQVYTLGSVCGWRNTGVITASLQSLRSVFFNGGLHWWALGRINIMVFDLSDETFHVLPGPFSDCGYMYTYIIRSFGEWLCVGGMNYENSSNCLDIWTYKKTSNLEKRMEATDDKGESWSWFKEFSIHLNSSAWYYHPIALTKSGLVVLVHDDRNRRKSSRDSRTLFCYNPQTATMKTLGIWNFFEAIPHANSFVSLKALGETTCKKRKRASTSSSGAQRLASLNS